MKNIKIKLILQAFLFSFLSFILDQLSKYAILEYFKKTNNIVNFKEVFGFLNFVEVYNTGVSFGMLHGSNKLMLTLIAAALCVYIVYLMIKEEKKVIIFTYACIIGGAFGNTVDRFFRIGVLDFIDVHFLGRHWPAFNVADSIICICVFILLFLNKKKVK